MIMAISDRPIPVYRKAVFFKGFIYVCHKISYAIIVCGRSYIWNLAINSFPLVDVMTGKNISYFLNEEIFITYGFTTDLAHGGG